MSNFSDFYEHVVVRWPKDAPPQSSVPKMDERIFVNGYPYKVTNPIPEAHHCGTVWAIRARPLNCEPDEPEWIHLSDIDE